MGDLLASLISALDEAGASPERGDHAEFERLWHDVLAESPGDQAALAKLSQLRDHGRDALPGGPMWVVR